MGIINNLIGQANPGRFSGRSYNTYNSSRHDDFMGQLEELMNNAPDEMTRQGLERMMAEMENR